VRVLFLCTGNSARSQMAEAILEQVGGRDFEVDSAGTDPRGVNPRTLLVLADAGIDWSAATSKSVEQFVARPLDYVITVCDRARQACPVFPGPGTMLHWDVEDPAEATGSDADKTAAFGAAYADLRARIEAFVAEVPVPAVAVSVQRGASGGRRSLKPKRRT
jgi:thioredoxin type arsenate reductase